MADSPEIESRAQFQETPAGIQRRLTLEIEAAKKNQEEFWTDGDKVVKEFLGQGPGGKKRLNLFHADVVTKGAQLYGNIPTVRARRRFADAKDDVARVSAEILERMLSTDIERDSDGFQTALDNALGDWLKAGLGVIRFRYVVETEQKPGTPAQVDPETGVELAPEVPAQDVKTFEDVETDYVHWRDVLWSPCRTWDEVRWLAFKAEMSREACVERFGEEIGNRIPLKAKDAGRDDDKLGVKDTWSRAEVWEVWSKEDGQVYWYAEGMDVILDAKPDPLGLPNFFPCPKPLAANVTTSKFLPRANYLLVEGLYEEAHELTKRIKALVKAVKVAGVYDRANEGVQRLLSDACENELVPIDNWLSFQEKGGVAGAMGFLPIEATVAAIVALVQQRNLVKQSLYEITGQSDIMRGQAAEKATATEQRIKARFGGTRIVSEQRTLAQFASEAQRIRAAIISKHFDPRTIIQRSNIQASSQDAALIPQAVDLLKQDVAAYRVEVDADSLSMTDFDAQQQEGVAIMGATAEFFKNFAPLITNPAMGAFVLELYQQFISQFRGAQRFEAIIDRGIAQLKEAAAQPPPPPQPDPKVEGEKIKLQGIQMKAQADAGKAQADMQKTMMGAQIERESFGMRMAEIQARRAAAADMPMLEEGEA